MYLQDSAFRHKLGPPARVLHQGLCSSFHIILLGCQPTLQQRIIEADATFGEQSGNFALVPAEQAAQSIQSTVISTHVRGAWMDHVQAVLGRHRHSQLDL